MLCEPGYLGQHVFVYLHGQAKRAGQSMLGVPQELQLLHVWHRTDLSDR